MYMIMARGRWREEIFYRLYLLCGWCLKAKVELSCLWPVSSWTAREDADFHCCLFFFFLTNRSNTQHVFPYLILETLCGSQHRFLILREGSGSPGAQCNHEAAGDPHPLSWAACRALGTLVGVHIWPIKICPFRKILKISVRWHSNITSLSSTSTQLEHAVFTSWFEICIEERPECRAASEAREAGFITNSEQTNLGDVQSWGTQTFPGPWLQPDFLPLLTYPGRFLLVGMKAFLSLLVFVQIQPGIIDIFLEITQYSFIWFNTGMYFIWDNSLWFFVVVVLNFCIFLHPPSSDE